MNTITRDWIVSIDRNGVSLDVTYEVHFDPITKEVETYRPIHVTYANVVGHTHEWYYGENMPSRIVNALEAFRPDLQERLEHRVSRFRYC